MDLKSKPGLIGECSPLIPIGIAKGLLLLVGIAYCLQVVSPLRINTDSYRLLSMAVSAKEGHGYLVEGRPDQFPNGYPFVVKVCLQAGIANSAALIGLNLIFYSIGLFIIWVLACRIQGVDLALIAVIWLATSWLIVKHVTLPLSDAGYFALSTAALFCLWKFYNGTLAAMWLWLVLAVVLIYFALQFRTVGITLLPAAAASVTFHSSLRPFWVGLAKHKPKIGGWLAIITTGGIACLIWVVQTDWFASQFLAKGSYFQSMIGYFERQGIIGFFGSNFGFRLLEMGEIAMNFPENKTPDARPLFYAIGMTGWVCVAIGAVWLLRRGMMPVVAYMIAYFGLMMAWPYYDTRFWIPLLPIFALAVWGLLADLSTNNKAFRLYLTVIFAGYILLGLLALVFSSRISLSGPMVSEYFGEETTRMTYREALQNGLPVEAKLVHPGKVEIIKLFSTYSVK